MAGTKLNSAMVKYIFAGSQAPAWELREEAPASCNFSEAGASKACTQAGAWEPAALEKCKLECEGCRILVSK